MNAPAMGTVGLRSRRIAVVIPSYNHAAFIGEAIGSVFAQTHADIELHVIDDGSTDGSPRVIEQALAAAPAGMRCEFIARGHRGCSATLNELIAGVRAEWVAILNSDDLLVPTRFEQMLLEVPEAGHHLSFSAVEFLFRGEAPDSEMWHALYPSMFRNGLVLPTVGFSLLMGNFAITSSNFLFNRSLFDQVGGFRDELPLSQDWDFLLRALQHVEPVFHPEILLRYRVHASNTYRNHRGRQQTELRLLYESFGAWASGNSENRLAPTPRNWPRLFPVFARVCRLGGGDPIGSLLPPGLVRSGAHPQTNADLPEGFERVAIQRLLSNGAGSPSREELTPQGLARVCRDRWSAVRALVGGAQRQDAVRDGVFSWSGASVRVTTQDPRLLERIGRFTGLAPTLDIHDPKHLDLLIRDERTVRIHAAERSEDKMFSCPEDLFAWLVLSVSDLLAIRARLTLVHGASFLLKDGVILLCGEPWSGKSTFTLRALSSGLPVLGDDQTWIDPADGAASPCPRPVKRRIIAGEDPELSPGWAGTTLRTCLDGEPALLVARGSSGFVPVGVRLPVRWVIHLGRKPDPGLNVETLEPDRWGPALRAQMRNFATRSDQAADLIADALSGAVHLRLSVGEGEVDAAFRWMLELH
jgi:glycosyltransferase involved in cell wall biosynthesis